MCAKSQSNHSWNKNIVILTFYAISKLRAFPFEKRRCVFRSDLVCVCVCVFWRVQTYSIHKAVDVFITSFIWLIFLFSFLFLSLLWRALAFIMFTFFINNNFHWQNAAHRDFISVLYLCFEWNDCDTTLLKFWHNFLEFKSYFGWMLYLLCCWFLLEWLCLMKSASFFDGFFFIQYSKIAPLLSHALRSLLFLENQ